VALASVAHPHGTEARETLAKVLAHPASATQLVTTWVRVASSVRRIARRISDLLRVWQVMNVF
jgi:hypothetical protein